MIRTNTIRVAAQLLPVASVSLLALSATAQCPPVPNTEVFTIQNNVLSVTVDRSLDDPTLGQVGPAITQIQNLTGSTPVTVDFEAGPLWSLVLNNDNLTDMSGAPAPRYLIDSVTASALTTPVVAVVSTPDPSAPAGVSACIVDIFMAWNGIPLETHRTLDGDDTPERLDVGLIFRLNSEVSEDADLLLATGYAITRDGVITEGLNALPFKDTSVFKLTYPRLRPLPFQGSGTSGPGERIAASIVDGLIIREPRTSKLLKLLGTQFAGAATQIDPSSTGGLLNAEDAGGELSHPGTLTMPWIAYYDEDHADRASFLFGAFDAYGWQKDFGLVPEGGENDISDNLEFSITSYPEGNLIPGGDYPLQLPASGGFVAFIGVASGDWFDSARRYRKWAQNQYWWSDKMGEPGSDFSTAVQNADFFGAHNLEGCAVDISGNLCSDPSMQSISSTVSRPNELRWNQWKREIEALQMELDGDLLGMIYNWGREGVASETYGDWYEGPGMTLPSAFEMGTRSIETLTGFSWAPYFNALVYSDIADGFVNSYVPGFSGTSVSAVSTVNSDGSLKTTPAFDQYSEEGVECSPGGPLPAAVSAQCFLNYALSYLTPFPEAYFKQTCENLAELGAGGIYLDVFHAASPLEYIAEPGSPKGGGSVVTERKRAVAEALRSHMRVGLPPSKQVPDWFQGTEMPYEYALHATDWAFSNNRVFVQGTINPSPLNAVEVSGYTAPIFDAVYHRSLRRGRTLSTSLDDQNPLIQSDAGLCSVRRFLAADIAVGRMPSGGLVVGEPGLDSILNNPANAAYQEVFTMLRNWGNAVQNAEGQSTIIEGIRLRDPIASGQEVEVTSTGTLDTGSSSTVPTFTPAWLQLEATNTPYGPTQPHIYSFAYQANPDSSQPLAIGIGLINWTTEEDELLIEPAYWNGTMGGPQSITLTIDNQEYGFPDGTYALRTYDSNGAFVDSTLTFNNGATITLTIPSLESRLLYLSPL